MKSYQNAWDNKQHFHLAWVWKGKILTSADHFLWIRNICQMLKHLFCNFQVDLVNKIVIIPALLFLYNSSVMAFDAVLMSQIQESG